MFPAVPTRMKDMDWAAEEVESPSHPNNVMLLNYWESKRRDGAPPARADINPTELKAILGGLYMAEPAGPDDFRYRLTGGDVEGRTGRAFTGSLVTEMFTPEKAAATIGVYHKVIAKGGPIILRGHFKGIGIEHVEFESLMMPLVFDDGRRGILGGQYAFN